MTTTQPNSAVPDTPAELVEQHVGEPPASNVIEALRRVIRDLPAIGKEGTGPSSQGSYKYRGIEQITRHAAPLFARHGLVMAPHAIVWRPTREIDVNGKPNTDESLLVTYRVYGPGGVDDYIEVQAPGIGRDSSDKGSNKAMTAAFKYALTQVLLVADAKDDNDAHHDDTDEPYQPLLASPAQMEKIRELCRVLRDREVEVTETNDEGEVAALGVKVLTKNAEGKLWPAIVEDDAEKLIGALNAKLADVLLEAGESPSPTAPTQPSEPAPVSEGTGASGGPEAGVGGRTRTQEQIDREARAREQLLAVSSKPSGAEAKGAITGKAKDDTEAKFTDHVNGLAYSVVVEQLVAKNLSVEGRPQEVRRRLRDHLVEQSAAAHSTPAAE